MPIYEFLCRDCNVLFNFFSAKIDTETSPACPRCEAELERRPASFATLKHAGEDEPDPFADLDEAALDSAMAEIAGELEGASEDDPRTLARAMRRFGDASGMELGPRMEEMLARLEGGADPDALEEELGGDLDSDEALGELFKMRRALAGEIRRRPRLDKELYFL